MGMLGSLGHQILLPEQKEIFRYWRQQCLIKGLPSHQDIDPQFIKTFLPTISLTEACHAKAKVRYKFRLAGTGFYNLFEQEITGRYLDELPHGDRAEYWDRIYGSIFSSARPRIGVTRPGTPCGSHMYQFWIRMPLSNDGKTVNMILGFDKFMKKKQLKDEIIKQEKMQVNQ